MSTVTDRTPESLHWIAAAVQAANAAQTNVETSIARALHDGATWTQIAETLGVSRQSAHQRYRRLRYDPTSDRAWHEPPLPI